VAQADDFKAVREDPDPIRRGRRAGELMTLYQQRAADLARLRRAAIEEAHRDQGMSFTEIAKAIGLSKGRITQIRSDAPPPERAFFGVGPVTVGVPHRKSDRPLPVIAAEDAQTAAEIEEVLVRLALGSTRVGISPEQSDPPAGDAVVVCGPASAPLGGALLAADSALGMREHDGRWWIEDMRRGDRYSSPSSDTPPRPADVGYLGRHRSNDRVIVHIAGLHAIGSLGVAVHLAQALPELFAETGDASFSMVIASEHDGMAITKTDAVAGPYLW
jgi:hypothetical protein